MIVVATRTANSCHYCVVAHGALIDESDFAALREHGFSDEFYLMGRVPRPTRD